MGRNTKLQYGLLKVSRVTLVNLISLIIATSRFIHLLPFVF